MILARSKEWQFKIEHGAISSDDPGEDGVWNRYVMDAPNGFAYYPDAELRTVEVLRRIMPVTVLEHVPLESVPGLVY